MNILPWFYIFYNRKYNYIFKKIFVFAAEEGMTKIIVKYFHFTVDKIFFL